MINKKMNTPEQVNNKGNNEQKTKPNEVCGYSFSSSIKIFDPNTKEVIVHQRGDS
jgi:hypothetical protein